MTPMEYTNLISILDSRKQELFDLLSSLVRINSENYGSYGNEAAVADYIADYLKSLGYTPDVYSPDSIPGIMDCPDYWAGHNLGNRPNVTCIIPGSDHTRRVMLAAHSDTVPIGNPANWEKDPLSGEQSDGKIWGRGACDDKYGVAAALFLIRVLKDENIVLPYDLVFTAYCDEERGGGNGTLAACLKYPCDDIVNLDCKNFEIWAAAVGGGELETRIRSKKPLDSSAAMLPGLNVVAAEMEHFKSRRQAELSAHPAYADTIIPSTSVRFMEMRAGTLAADLDRARTLITFYTLKTKEEIDAELEEMKKRLEIKLAPLGLEFEAFQMYTRFFHFKETASDNPCMDALIAASDKVSGRKIGPCGSCLSDLSLFIKYGSPRAFSFGIGRDFNAYGGAHQANEFIECDPFIEFAKTLGVFLTNN